MCRVCYIIRVMPTEVSDGEIDARIDKGPLDVTFSPVIRRLLCVLGHANIIPEVNKFVVPTAK